MSAGVTEQEVAFARVYADAVLELAQQSGDVDVLWHELQEIARHAQSDEDFAMFLASPIVDGDARRDTLEKLFRGKCTDLLVDTLQVLNRKGRLHLVPALAEAYRRGREELLGRIEVRVRSAAPLTESHRQQLAAVIRQQTGKEPDLLETVDPSLLGGLVVQVGDRKLDASIARKLDRLSRRLRERASRELHGGRSFVEAAPV